MYDLVMHNGTAVDGTGRPRCAGGVAVDESVISAFGAVSGPPA
jgi:N-acyl-D-aspartate/D-glutamate deacylase